MRLIARQLDELPEPRLEEGDPFPPEDRARPIEIDALYRTHSERLLRFFARRAGRADADDLVHEAFARLAGADGRSRGAIESPGAYLTRIATNLLRDRARSEGRRPAEGNVVYDERLHGALDPHQSLDDRDSLARLDAAIGRLNRRTRTIFLLQRVEGLTYAQIADQMGMSVKGVKKQMAKALLQLRRDLGPL